MCTKSLNFSSENAKIFRSGASRPRCFETAPIFKFKMSKSRELPGAPLPFPRQGPYSGPLDPPEFLKAMKLGA